ncbi:MAG: hypothetical protein ISR91_04435 [Candidatus Delongbacteria bacterium]|nr:hypothetical protein [Candidatus Delongbacteria bacterium]
MICAGSNSPSAVQAWLTSNGVSTVTGLVYGGGVYNQYGNGSVPYNVFLDSEFIVRFTAAGWGMGYYNQWCALAEQYGGYWDYPVFEDLAYDIVSEDNGDGFPNPGETCEMTVTVSNHANCPTGTGLTAIVTSVDPDITIVQGNLDFPDIEAGQAGTSTNTVTFSVAPGAPLHNAPFQISLDGNELLEPQLLSFAVPLFAPCDAPTLEISYTIIGSMAFATLHVSGGNGDNYIIEKSSEPHNGFELLGVLPNSPNDVDTWVDMANGRWFYRVKSECE